VISNKRDKVVAVWHGRIDADLFGEELAMLGYYYNTAFIGIEVNNHGLTTNKALQRAKYPRIYARKRLDGKRSHRKDMDSIGWFTSRTSKPLMIDELARDVRNELVIPDQKTIGEMLTFVRDDKGHMSGSPFDDRVMSLAIANQMRSYARVHTVEEGKPYYWTFQYFMDKALKQGAAEANPRMGAHNVRAS
jgi:hypothetical protein